MSVCVSMFVSRPSPDNQHWWVYIRIISRFGKIKCDRISIRFTSSMSWEPFVRLNGLLHHGPTQITETSKIKKKKKKSQL